MTITQKSTYSCITTTVLIFSSWIIINYLGNEPFLFPVNLSPITPAIWSLLFIYLHKKKFTYIALNTSILLLLMLIADQVNFKDHINITQLSYLSLSTLSALFYVNVYQNIFPKKRLTALIICSTTSITLFITPLFYIIYAVDIKTPITEQAIYAILQTNLEESLEFLNIYISKTWILIVFLTLFFSTLFFFHQEKQTKKRIKNKYLLIFELAFFYLFYMTIGYNRLYVFAGNAEQNYKRELKLFKETQSKIQKQKIKFNASKQEKNETYIVIIGESLNKNHMGLYGYHRNTTPTLSNFLKEGKLVLFDNAFSSHTHTVQVLSQSLTEANQQNNKDYFKSLSIINILHKANIETYWITNQPIYGAWDNLVSVIAHQSDHLIPLNNSIGKSYSTQKHDDQVIPYVESIIEEHKSTNKAIFIHLMGNHSNYCLRFPYKYNMFSGNLTKSDFGKIANNDEITTDINCYDNSILFNDYVISSILKSIEKQDRVSALLYTSDHADDVVSKLAHHSDKFTYEMTQTPLTIWLSDKYKKKYNKKTNNLINNRNRLFSNDKLYDTLIGILNIKTDHYQEKNDLSSVNYFFDESHAYTLHGKIPYNHAKNYQYQQKKNIQLLKDHKQITRVIPHRVNSIGKLTNIWFNGYRAFEVDVIINDENAPYFEVGHDLSAMSGLSLENLIKSVPYNKIEKVWLDIKNLNQNNYKTALSILNNIDSQFNLKNKLIIESNTTKSFFSEFRGSGWHTSYYLPTTRIAKPLSENNKTLLKNYAAIINKQILTQNISALSFDNQLYPFVENYLEYKLPNSTKYHIKEKDITLYDSGIYKELNTFKYLLDKKTATISLDYKSHFNL